MEVRGPFQATHPYQEWVDAKIEQATLSLR
jgi:hypothetical protein